MQLFGYSQNSCYVCKQYLDIAQKRNPDYCLPYDCILLDLGFIKRAAPYRILIIIAFCMYNDAPFTSVFVYNPMYYWVIPVAEEHHYVSPGNLFRSNPFQNHDVSLVKSVLITKF